MESGAPLIADLRNGEQFKGVALGYFTRQIARFDLAQGRRVQAVVGRMGDVPALQVTAGKPGLWAVLHETTPSLITYKEWEKFQAFAAHKDFPDIRARHTARGLPEAGFAERYTRHAKALVAVGHGRGADQARGLETEFVALQNPYAGGDTLAVQLLYQGQPRSDAQIEMFARAPDGTVTVTLHRTDAQGQARLPVQPGHLYLLDAVVLRPADPASGAVWETLWAALTFEVP